MTDRIQMTLMIDNDIVPGTMHTPESIRDAVQLMLRRFAAHYNPVVSLDPPAEARPEFKHLSQDQIVNLLALEKAQEMGGDYFEVRRNARRIADGIKNGF